MLAALAALVTYALFGFFVVPRIVRGQIVRSARESLHREATVERVRFNPFTLALRIDGLALKDRDGAPLVAVHELRLDFELSGALRRALRFKTIRIRGPVVALRILEDGRPSLADLLEPSSAAESTKPARPARLIVDLLRLRGGRIEFTDRSRDPLFESNFEPLDLELRNLVTLPDESGQHAILIGLGQGAEIRWNGEQTVEPLAFQGRFDVTGLDLAWLWRYFGQGQPLDVASGRADLVLPYRLTKPAGQPLDVAVEGATLAAKDVVVRDRASHEEWFRFPETEVTDVRVAWPAARVDVGRVRAARPSFLLRIEESESQPPPAAEPAPAGKPWEFAVRSVSLEQAALRFEDRTADPDVTIDLTEGSASLSDVTSDPTKAIATEVHARVAETGTLVAKGGFAVRPLDVRADLELTDVPLAAVRPYVSVFPGAQLMSGRIGGRGTLTVLDRAPIVSFQGGARVDQVDLRDGKGAPLVSWDRLAIDGIQLEGSPQKTRVRSVVIDRGFAELYIDREHNLNLLQFTAPPEPQAATNEPPSKLEIGKLELRNSSLGFTDESLILPFGTRIHSLGGTVRDLSSFSAAPATVALEGRVEETGAVKVSGVLRLADPYASTDLAVAFRSLPMPKLTPYAAEFAGYAIERGTLDLDVRYQLIDRRLLGQHRVVASDFVLGQKIEGATGAGFPVRLAVALLKDKNGKIDLDVPVEGSIDSPEFAYRKVFWQAVKKILSHVATAPFRAIGRLFGGGDDDLELVDFDPGRSDLLPAEQDKLSKLAGELAPRAELSIEVEGRFDPLSDKDALKRAKLDAAIEAQRATAETQAAEAGGSTLETILESLYAERFSSEALAAERVRFLPAPPTAPPEPVTTVKKKHKRGEPEPPPTPQAPPGAFDAAGFYEALRSKLLQAQEVADGELADLARARSATIVTALTAGGLDAQRATAVDPTPVKRKKAGSDRIASEMTMTAKD